MKKILSLLLVLTMVLVAFAACGPQNDGNTPDDTDKTPAEKDYTLAIGVVVTESLAKSKLTETIATIVTDADGKIVACRLDSVDYTAKYGEDGALDTTAPTTKVTLGDNYGAMPAGTWAAQGAALEKYVTGKTQAEVAAIALEGGKATDAELVASCSIAITDLLKAIDNAFKSEHKISFKTAATELKVGLSMAAAVKDSSKDEAKNVKLTADYAAAVLAEGKVVAAILDSVEPELKGINAEGAATELAYKGTKREQGDNYGAMPAGTWYVQADAYVKAAIGKTADDIATLASEGVAGCTIYAGGYKAVIETAVKTAR
jgi:predicted small lipoprotein YifL